MICNKTLIECECPDLPERWAALKDNEHLFFTEEQKRAMDKHCRDVEDRKSFSS